MLSVIISHAPLGINGRLIFVEVDIRRGIPGIDIVGLPDNAVREAKERVRVAIRNSGFSYPADRILVNLAPAGIRKEGAAYDLSMALGILAASKQIPFDITRKIMVLGELNLCGGVRSTTGVLSAVGCGLENGTNYFIVSKENLREAQGLKGGEIFGISSLAEAAKIFSGITKKNQLKPKKSDPVPVSNDLYSNSSYGDFSDIRGQEFMKRALEVAAAGRHHLLLFGPPGSGKSMSVSRFPTILPQLTKEESLTVTRIHSLAGILPDGAGLIRYPPFRKPHHTASKEGIIGGGALPRPGEVSLAHKGVLFLDEAPEFKVSILQSLREPVEEDKVTIVRRIPLQTVPAEELVGEKGESSIKVRARVLRAVNIQRQRYHGMGFSWNSRIPPGQLSRFCTLDKQGMLLMVQTARKLGLSSRACHSIIKVARTIADLAASAVIKNDHLLEAAQHRRFGDNDIFWNFS
jgi:magnesium chelatase family protein